MAAGVAVGAGVVGLAVRPVAGGAPALAAALVVQARIDCFTPEVDGGLAPDLVGSPGRVRWAL